MSLFETKEVNVYNGIYYELYDDQNPLWVSVGYRMNSQKVTKF